MARLRKNTKRSITKDTPQPINEAPSFTTPSADDSELDPHPRKNTKYPVTRDTSQPINEASSSTTPSITIADDDSELDIPSVIGKTKELSL